MIFFYILYTNNIIAQHHHTNTNTNTNPYIPTSLHLLSIYKGTADQKRISNSLEWEGQIQLVAV